MKYYAIVTLFFFHFAAVANAVICYHCCVCAAIYCVGLSTTMWIIYLVVKKLPSASRAHVAWNDFFHYWPKSEHRPNLQRLFVG